MDIFNKNKVAELERIIERQERELENLRRERDKKNSGKHKTGAWCDGCKNLVIHQAYDCYPTEFCMLDNECKDREA